jgi:hypothetical protein
MSKSNPLGNLGSLIQPKGTAQRPVEMPQRGELAQPPVAAVQPAEAEAKKPTKALKALTYRMPVENWRVLRDYAHQKETSHQQVLDEALRRYCRDEGIVLPIPPAPPQKGNAS